MNKVRILILAKSIDGGTGSFVLHFLDYKKYFSKNNIDFKTVIFEKPLFIKVTNSKLKAMTFFRPSNSYSKKCSLTIKNLSNFVGDVLYINKIIICNNPDIIFSVNHYTNILLMISRFIFHFKNKIVLTTHNNINATIDSKSSILMRKILKKIISICYKHANYNIAVSNGLAEELKNNFKLNNVKRIYNGIASEQRNDSSFKKDRVGTKIIISIGRLEQQKDFETLIHAFHMLSGKRDDCVLRIIGDGEERIKLETIVASLKLRNKVQFLGWIQDVNKELNKADMFVLSSKREGFGYALVEAMSRGLPVISTDSPFGPSEILDKGRYGILIHMQDISAMADAMYKLIVDQRMYDFYAKKSLERARFFSLDKMMGSYVKVIKEISNK